MISRDMAPIISENNITELYYLIILRFCGWNPFHPAKRGVVGLQVTTQRDLHLVHMLVTPLISWRDSPCWTLSPYATRETENSLIEHQLL